MRGGEGEGKEGEREEKQTDWGRGKREGVVGLGMVIWGG